jgi:hypothetical protein
VTYELLSRTLPTEREARPGTAHEGKRAVCRGSCGVAAALVPVSRQLGLQNTGPLLAAGEHNSESTSKAWA